MPAATSDLFSLASNGTAPLTTTLTASHAIGAPTFAVAAVTGWPTSTLYHFKVYTGTTVGGVTTVTPGSETLWSGIVSGLTLGNLTLRSGTDQIYPINAIVEPMLTSAQYDNLINGILVAHNQDGTLKSTSIQTALGTGNIANTGYNALGYIPDVVTNNGNRSTTMVFNGTDLTSVLSPGMRIRTTRATPTNTYMGGALNGTSQYFTKVTPTGTLSTVTDNFTIMGFASPTAYASGCIAARSDATTANGIFLYMNSDGSVSVQVSNTAGNSKAIQSYQSLPLNKKTQVTGTWAAGVGNILFDGVVVAARVVNSGTAPTTAGTGGDFSIGRYGANSSGYFPGYLSNVAVFNTVLSLATIQQYGIYKLLGTETNCIGAWSLDNTLVDQFGANTLTAGGSASFSNIAPFATDGNNVATGNFDFGIVQRVTFSTNTTVVVQASEGCAFTTVASGISAVVYSSQKAPLGFVTNLNRWIVQFICNTDTRVANPVNTGYYTGPVGGATGISIPTGEWRVAYQGDLGMNHNATAGLGASVGLSINGTSLSELRFVSFVYDGSAIDNHFIVYREGFISTSSQTSYYLVFKPNNNYIGNSGFRGDFSPTVITAEPTYL